MHQPTRQEFEKQLQNRSWDILFFAGHSSSNIAESSWIKIKEDEHLSIQDLKYALRTAIDRGLSLAIFNSCDGLGLAAELAELCIPQTIVMREKVFDPVASKFLNFFITEFASGKSLYLAIRRARERLQGEEGKYPCASWLPVIFQNPGCQPLSWHPRKICPKVSRGNSGKFVSCCCCFGSASFRRIAATRTDGLRLDDAMARE